MLSAASVPMLRLPFYLLSSEFVAFMSGGGFILMTDLTDTLRHSLLSCLQPTLNIL